MYVVRTWDVECGLRAAQSDASRHVGGDATERTIVQRPIHPTDVQITVDLMSSTSVGQLAAVQRPVEHDLPPVGHITT